MPGRAGGKELAADLDLVVQLAPGSLAVPDHALQLLDPGVKVAVVRDQLLDLHHRSGRASLVRRRAGARPGEFRGWTADKGRRQLLQRPAIQKHHPTSSGRGPSHGTRLALVGARGLLHRLDLLLQLPHVLLQLPALLRAAPVPLQQLLPLLLQPGDLLRRLLLLLLGTGQLRLNPLQVRLQLRAALLQLSREQLFAPRSRQPLPCPPPRAEEHPGGRDGVLLTWTALSSAVSRATSARAASTSLAAEPCIDPTSDWSRCSSCCADSSAC